MSPRAFTKQEYARIETVKTYLLNALHERLTVPTLARKAAMGEERFREGFFKLFQMAVGSYVSASRMQTGRFLLHHTDKTIKEIGRICGYKQYKSFLKAYKKFFGVAAGASRKDY